LHRAYALGNFLFSERVLIVVETQVPILIQIAKHFCPFLQECLGISNKVKMKVLSGWLYHGNFSM
jgi:hypothetical protein